jgi:hypothetical protein
MEYTDWNASLGEGVDMAVSLASKVRWEEAGVDANIAR